MKMQFQEINQRPIDDQPSNAFLQFLDNGQDEDSDSDSEECSRPITYQFYEDPELNQVVGEFMKKFTKHRMNRSQGKGMWSVVKNLCHRLGIPAKSYDTTERKVKECMPTPKVTWKVLRRDNGSFKEGSGESFPEKKFKDRNKFEVRSVWTRVALKDLIDFHYSMHPKSKVLVNGHVDYKKVKLSFTYDGIPYAKSSSDTLNVMGVQFSDCRQVYIPHVRVAKKAEAKDLAKFLNPFVNEVIHLGVKVNYFLADAPMRAFIKCIKGHAGRFSCEVCEAEGQVIQRKVCYPPSQRHGRRRNHKRWIELVEDLEAQSEEGNPGNVKGLTGRSPLLRIPEFDMIKKAPPDPFHRDWLGIVKSTLWKHTVGLNKTGIMNRRGQRITQELSDIYRDLNLPSEFSRRSRPIDYANYKGQEWKSLTISCFWEICDSVQKEIGQQTAHVWLLYTYLVIIYNGPKWCREALGEDQLVLLHGQLYELFSDEFGPGACTFKWHSFSHMPEICDFGTPQQLSTEPYESAYGRVKTAYRPGTRNIGLQIARTMLLRCVDHVEGIHCTNRLKIRKRTKDIRFDDSIVMDEYFNFYKVVETCGKDIYAKPIKKKNWKCPHDTSLDMSLAGIFIYKGVLDEIVTINRANVMGKGILTARKLLIPFTTDMLFS